jgi:hypothetical protein
MGVRGWTATNAAIKARVSPAAVGCAQVAQLVEHATENRSVGGSIPPLGTTIHLRHRVNDARGRGEADTDA